MVLDSMFDIVGCNLFGATCGGRWKWKSKSLGDNEAADAWNDLTFLHSIPEVQPPSIPHLVQLDHANDEDISTIFDPQLGAMDEDGSSVFQSLNPHGKPYSYEGKEVQYHDLQLVMEELENELSEEMKQNDDTASLEIIMGPPPPPPPPSRVSSSRSVTSATVASLRSIPPPPPAPLKRVTADIRSSVFAQLMAVTFQRKETEKTEAVAPPAHSLGPTTLLSSSSLYTYSASQGDKKDDASEYENDDGSSYSSYTSRRLLGDTKKQSFDFSSFSHHSYHPSARHSQQSISFQTNSTDTTFQAHNHNRGRVRASSAATIRAH